MPYPIILVRTTWLLTLLFTCETFSTSYAQSNAIALCIGLDKVDPAKYAGWDGELFACHHDANDMKAIASSAGFSVGENGSGNILLSSAATRDAVLAEIRKASENLSAGGIFFISYSGHGGQVYDENGDEQSNGSEDELDETWCLFDGQLIDDEIYAAFGQFKAGIRIFVLSDSCHSGTVAKSRFYNRFAYSDETTDDLELGIWRTRAEGSSARELSDFFRQFDANLSRAAFPRERKPSKIIFRAMPLEVAKKTWASNRDFYRAIGTAPWLRSGKTTPAREGSSIAASGLLISGCQDNQNSKDGWRNGAFTGSLRRVWERGIAVQLMNYSNFHNAIKNEFASDPTQTPNLYTFGEYSSGFYGQKPFTAKTP